jgi:hypothetical protein
MKNSGEFSYGKKATRRELGALRMASNCCPDVEFQNHYNFNQYSQLQSILAAIDLNRDL